ncbi:MAG TPA: hypothetical protein VG346_05705 [Acidimicrobiales bacterium]|nr:hypothetical protein [Acidimicrobiales bacterium]
MAVGSYEGSTTQLTLTEMWNGSTWSIVPSPNGSTTNVNSLTGISCTSASWCIATGAYSDGSVEHTLAESWDGHSWTVMATVDPSTASGSRSQSLGGVVCFSATDCTAVGSYTVGVNTAQTLVEQWNGTAWLVVPSPNAGAGNNYLGNLSCLLPTSCMAVGAANGLPLFESWNGSTWSIVPNPNPSPSLGDALNDVTCTNRSFCVAVGDQHAASMSYPSLIEMWNGTSWAIVPSPSMPSSDENILEGVACTDPTNCVATGHWSDANDTTDQTFIERWDGTSWSIVSSPNTSSTLQNDLSGVTCSAGTQCITVGDASTLAGPSQTLIETAPVMASGYYEVASDGGLFAYHAPFYGSMGSTPLNKPIVGMAYDPATGGYWEVASDGGVFAFNAPFYGSMGGTPLNKPIVGMAALADGSGYYEVASDGGLFAFNAPFLGSMGGKALNKPVVGMAVDQATGGYYEVASDGGLFAFNAPFQGSMGGKPLNMPVVGMAVQPDGSGYWEVASDGGLFAFNAPFFGSAGALRINAPVVGMATS